MSSVANYKDARSRFVISEITRDGAPWMQVHDPVLNVTGSVPIKDRHHLLTLFRGAWLAAHAGRPTDPNAASPRLAALVVAGWVIVFAGVVALMAFG